MHNYIFNLKIDNYFKYSASLTIAEQYVRAFGELAKQNNTLILSNNVNDVSSMVTQAMGIFKQVSNSKIGGDKIDVKKTNNTSEYYSDFEEDKK